MFTENTQKYPKFYCEKCDFITNNKKDYNRHILTRKHLNVYNCLHESPKKTQKNICLCGKEYSCRQSLYTHKKKCNYIEPSDDISCNSDDSDKNNNNNNINQIITSEMVMLLIKDNSELKHMMMEVIKNGTHNTNNNTTNTNSHNKTFNLQFFLNETCKDAMNIMDFVDSIKFQLADLEKMGEIGFVNGISNIIIKNLKNLDITQRPVHCTDKKREVIYVKDEDKWEKEEQTKNTKVRKAIKRVANKNMRLLTQFREKHPDCNKSESKYSDQYNKLVIEAMGGLDNKDYDNETKIITKLSKEIVIDKSESEIL